MAYEKGRAIEFITQLVNARNTVAFVLGMSFGVSYRNQISCITDLLSGRHAPAAREFIQNPYEVDIVRPLNKEGCMEVYVELPDSSLVPLYNNIGKRIGEIYGTDKGR